jgi:hypothetical protein
MIRGAVPIAIQRRIFWIWMGITSRSSVLGVLRGGSKEGYEMLVEKLGKTGKSLFVCCHFSLYPPFAGWRFWFAENYIFEYFIIIIGIVR